MGTRSAVTDWQRDQDDITRRYERLAAIYDIYEAPMEAMGGRRRRQRLLARARGQVLEVGVGTGRTLEHYPGDVEITAIDVSARMLERAAHRAAALGLRVGFERADVHELPFAEASFDCVAASCVFCSVADPVRGLAEIRRVVRSDGQVLLLEHVRPSGRIGGWIADVVSPLTSRLVGPELNRRTETNIAAAGLVITEVRREGVWREIVARRRWNAEDASADRSPSDGDPPHAPARGRARP